ncbi:MAG: NUDIX hydrolase, partial [Pseudomonadota bacterium]
MAENREGGRAVRPKDAATLIIVQRDKKHPLVLMGQRHADHKFMPNKFVFPGGRVDPADGRLKLESNLAPHVERRLTHDGRTSLLRARALALAAIRETFEETGLVVGNRTESQPKTRAKTWSEYFAKGVVPDLSALDLVARAITPPYRNRRFDARFFMIDAGNVHNDTNDDLAGSGELLDLRWVSLKEAQKLDLPNITRRVLGDIEVRASVSV